MYAVYGLLACGVILTIYNLVEYFSNRLAIESHNEYISAILEQNDTAIAKAVSDAIVEHTLQHVNVATIENNVTQYILKHRSEDVMRIMAELMADRLGEDITFEYRESEGEQETGE